jgi:hypothetical protein
MTDVAAPRAVALRHLARVIRSKNAKPYRLTLDVIFDSREIFEYVRDSGALNDQAVAAAYGLPVTAVSSSFVFEPGLAFKFTFIRQLTQGAFGESDQYGAQQHAPLLDLPIPWAEDGPSISHRNRDEGRLS